MGTYTAYCLQIVLELYVGIKIRIKIGIEYKNLKWAIEDGIDRKKEANTKIRKENT